MVTYKVSLTAKGKAYSKHKSIEAARNAKKDLYEHGKYGYHIYRWYNFESAWLTV